MSITRAFAKKLTDYDNQASMGTRIRSKRISRLLEMIETVSREHGFVNIIDIGGTERYWNIISQEFLEQHNVSITIVNLPGTGLRTNNHRFKFVAASGCDLSRFDDDSFHIAHSNSVVEHVGDWRDMVQFAKELSRVGQKYFVQTPNYWFPVEPHCMTPFFHWLPKPIKVWLVARRQLGHWERATSIDHAVRIVESARLLNRKMFQELFQDATVLTERLFLFPKSLIAIKT